MTVRELEISERAAEKAQRVRDYARKEKNWYRPGSARIPGEIPKHCCKLNDFRCVFSYTVSSQDHKVYRHLSISVPEKGALPNPAAVQIIAQLFGFTWSEEEAVSKAGFPESWILDVREGHPIDDDCIVIIQDSGLRS